MRCPKCNNDLAISSQFTISERDGLGETKIFSVVDLTCTDENCPNGRRGMPVARLKRLIENSNHDEKAVTCCGIPLIYLASEKYWIPDERAQRPCADGHSLALVCPSCGKTTSVDVSGRVRV
ncbi:MAG: hypothetical protein RR998_06385 [Oscillospiraceae bacterium]